MTTRLRRGVAVALLAGLALLLGAAPAFAHARLESTDPADGASLATGPERVSLTFSDPMSADFNTITVVGPDNARYETGSITAQNNTVSIGVGPLGPAGRYEIGYRVVSEDGHPVTGSVAFTLTAAGPGAAPAAAASAPAAGPAAPEAASPAPAAAASNTSDSGGAPVWPWIVGAVVLVGGGVVAALRLGR
ncbi:copper resistance protein CopC [Pseudonocardia aurantiaca]|uniref:copper resistance CopC family protein n=1 Tax=Pseudonocardia aurantiaca TaxID=75290 RepID=UPI0031D38D62